MYVTEWSGMHCIGYVCVSQRKDPEEELLRVLLGASKLLICQPPSTSMSVPNRTGIEVRQVGFGVVETYTYTPLTRQRSTHSICTSALDFKFYSML